MQAAYRMWLKRRYGTLDELNRSWKSSFADWSLIDIPSRAERLAGEGTLLRTSSGSGNCGDYYRFFSDYTVELIGDFGRTVKEASGGKLLFAGRADGGTGGPGAGGGNRAISGAGTNPAHLHGRAARGLPGGAVPCLF